MIFRCPLDDERYDIAAPHPTPALAPAAPGFTCAERIGQGGSGSVFAARRDEDGAPAAIKVGHSAATLLIERFRREADALRRIGPPHVARLLGHGVLGDGRPYIAMERLKGRTLAAQLSALAAPAGAPHGEPGGAATPVAPPDPSWVAERADAVLAALEAAHARGVLHRDLKPGNIFLTEPDERVVLLDFGLARRAPGRAGVDEAALTRTGLIVGTPEYMAPEQIRGDQAVDARADLYAFGVVLFQMLALRPPFVGDAAAVQRAHLTLRPPRPSELAPVPDALEELVLACLAKDPARRPQSAVEIRRALADASSVRSARAPSAAPQSASGARLLGEGAQPVVVLVVDAPGAATVVAAAVGERKGIVARRRGRRYVAVFSGRESEDPARAALAVAHALVDRLGARAALHLSVVTTRSRANGPPAVFGAAVDRPESWVPAEPWSGVALTPELERHLAEQGATEPLSEEGAPETRAEAPLVGRDDVLDALAAGAGAAFDGTCPALLTLIGDEGIGKTRLAAEAAQAARRAFADALILEVRASPPAASMAAAPQIEQVLRWIQEEDGPATPPGPPATRRRGLVQAIAGALRRRASEHPVAVILDDAHWADDALLDALEYATLDGAGIRLWAVVVAHRRFDQQRRAWGARSQRHAKVSLAPLDEVAGAALAAHLLLPAEYTPAAALRRLATWSGGNPACLREIVRSLKRAGAVRRRPSGGSWYLATAELETFSATPAWQWLAARQLDALPPDLAAFARICAVHGASFTRSEIEGVLDAAQRAGSAGSPIDAGVGLEALSSRGLVRRCDGERYAFHGVVVQDAIYCTLDPDQRVELHGHALAYWRSRASAGAAAPAELEALARHAAARGARDEAADAHLRLGDGAFARHRHVEADGRYTAALSAAAPEDAPRRARALAGRGRARYRIHRVREARDDFAAALELAAMLGDTRLRADVLLEDATALDWNREFDESARRVDEARALVEARPSEDLELRLMVADGRTLWRQRRTNESTALLERAIARAEASNDYEARVMALLMLSFQLASAGRTEEAGARFQEVIESTEAARDWLHLCVSLSNRVVLWMAKDLPARAVEDLRRVVELAREIGNPWLEHITSFNVALMLYRCDEQREALAYARRARALGERLLERPIPSTPFVLADILLVLEDYEEAASLVAWMDRSAPPRPDDLPFYYAMRLVLAEVGCGGIEPPAVGWDEVIRMAEERRIPTEEILPLLYWRARMALAHERVDEAVQTLDEARSRRGGCSMWLHRFEELEGTMTEQRRPGPAHRPDPG